MKGFGAEVRGSRQGETGRKRPARSRKVPEVGKALCFKARSCRAASERSAGPGALGAVTARQGAAVGAVGAARCLALP